MTRLAIVGISNFIQHLILFFFNQHKQLSKGQAGHNIFPPFRNISSHAKSISMAFPKVGAKPTGQGGSAPIRSDGGCGVDLTGPTCLAKHR